LTATRLAFNIFLDAGDTLGTRPASQIERVSIVSLIARNIFVVDNGESRSST